MSVDLLPIYRGEEGEGGAREAPLPVTRLPTSLLSEGRHRLVCVQQELVPSLVTVRAVPELCRWKAVMGHQRRMLDEKYGLHIPVSH